jgi:hypothetical protein
MWYENEAVDGYSEGLNPMCAMLYTYSGKCNTNMNSYDAQTISNYYANANNDENGNGGNYNQMYQSQAQEENEEAVCSFLNMINSNTYSDDGYIVLTNDWTKNVRREFADQVSAMDTGMKAGLILSALAVVGMIIWAAMLHGTLSRKNIPWRPRRGKASSDATQFSRAQSGIVVGRHNGTAPLI